MFALALLSLVTNLLSIHVGTSDTLDCVPVVMAGYDVVYYFKDSTSECDAKKGSPKHSYNLDSADWNGTMRTYQFWFSSQENLDYFTADPWKYAPKYGGFCSYGTCCEKSSGGWPWSSTWLGPPAGPDSSRCGFRVDNGSLYFNIWNSYDSTFFSQSAKHISAADERWIGWFGKLHAGPFNWGCFSTSGWNYMDCVYSPLDDAPESSNVLANGLTRCDNVDSGDDETTTTVLASPAPTEAIQDAIEAGDSDSSEEESETQGNNVASWLMIVAVIAGVMAVIICSYCLIKRYGICGKIEIAKRGKSVKNLKKGFKKIKNNKRSFVELREEMDDGTNHENIANMENIEVQTEGMGDVNDREGVIAAEVNV